MVQGQGPLASSGRASGLAAVVRRQPLWDKRQHPVGSCDLFRVVLTGDVASAC